MNFPNIDIPAIYSSIYGKIRKYDEDIANTLQKLSGDLSNIFRNGVSITDNVDAQTISYTSNAIADTEDTVAHTLKREPTGFIVVDTDKAGIVYRGGTAFTTTDIYLKCSTASTALKVLIF